jgi:hypothetical protein
MLPGIALMPETKSGHVSYSGPRAVVERVTFVTGFRRIGLELSAPGCTAAASETTHANPADVTLAGWARAPARAPLL